MKKCLVLSWDNKNTVSAIVEKDGGKLEYTQFYYHHLNSYYAKKADSNNILDESKRFYTYFINPKKEL